MLARAPAAAAAALARRGVASWSRFSPAALGGDAGVAAPPAASNLVFGEWQPAQRYIDVPDPLTGAAMVRVPDTQLFEVEPFVRSLRAVPKSGLHNPLKLPERYLLYGDVCAAAAAEMRRPEVARHFAGLIQRTSPKSAPQADAEVAVTRKFLENFGGDQVRFLARSFGVPGDHAGQQSNGYRWPWGPVAVVAPFNFPLEIPALQLLGALFMGNKPLLHVDHKVSVVMEEFLRLLHACGMPPADADLLHGRGPTAGEVLAQARPRAIQFTGSKATAERLAAAHHGKVFLEDAGFDWKILGPDPPPRGSPEWERAVWQADQDAYACSGQKCSAQSLLFVHDAWAAAGVEADLAARAARRSLADLTVGPVLTWTTGAMLAHAARLLAIPGARLAWGGAPLPGPHSIPERYGAIAPTAVFVPLAELLKPEHFEAATTEVFGPFQVLTRWADADLPAVLAACERMGAHLTAAVVSSDVKFVTHVAANTVNGTTYVGGRARTTGAPQNHWFGPAGDPRAAGIGTPEAIRLVWSGHREIIGDWGPVPHGGAPLVQS